MNEFTLKSGAKVRQPFNKIWFIVLAVVILTVIFSLFIPFDPSTFRLGELPIIFQRLFVPYDGRNWGDYFGMFKHMGTPLMQSIQISLGGTLIGSLLAFPIAFLSAGNIIKNKFISVPIKLFMNLIRSIPIVILAILAVFTVGLGVLSGIGQVIADNILYNYNIMVGVAILTIFVTVIFVQIFSNWARRKLK